MESTEKINLTEQELSEARQYSRSEVDLGIIVELDIKFDDSESHQILRGIVFDSSFGGCGIILVNKNINILEQNLICYLRIPEEINIPIKVRIVWLKEIHNNIFRCGLEYMN